MNQKQIRQLTALADQQDQLNARAAKLWNEIIKPAGDACESPEEVRELMHEVSLACTDEELRVRDLPSDYGVRFVMLMDAVRQKMRAKAA